MITNVKTVAVYVSDQEEAVRFYTEKLGFEVRRNQLMGPGGNWIEVAPPGAQSRVVIYHPRHDEGLARAQAIDRIGLRGCRSHSPRTVRKRCDVHAGPEEDVVGHLCDLRRSRWERVRADRRRMTDEIGLSCLPTPRPSSPRSVG